MHLTCEWLAPLELLCSAADFRGGDSTPPNNIPSLQDQRCLSARHRQECIDDGGPHLPFQADSRTIVLVEWCTTWMHYWAPCRSNEDWPGGRAMDPLVQPWASRIVGTIHRVVPRASAQHLRALAPPVLQHPYSCEGLPLVLARSFPGDMRPPPFRY